MNELAELSTHQTIVACLLGGLGIVGVVVVVLAIVWWFRENM